MSDTVRGRRDHAWPLVGRTEELAQLDRLLQRARTGATTVAVVTGDAGVGKSALVRHWSRGIDVAPVVVWGSEADARFHLGVVEQLIRLVGGENGASGDDDVMAAGAALVSLLPSTEAAEPRVLVVEDAHWADDGSLRALTFACRRLLVEPVLVVVVARDDVSLPEGLLRLADQSDDGRLQLDPLTEVELGELVEITRGVDLSPRARRRLHDHTGGTPLHVRALIEEVDPASLNRLHAPLPAPRSFRLMIAGRLRALSASAESLVAAASILGAQASTTLARDVAGVDDVADALQEAVDHGLLVIDGDGYTVAFPHALIRAAVYDLLGPARRSQMHRSAASAVGASTVAGLEHRIAGTLVEDASLAHEVIAAAWAAWERQDVDRAAGLLRDAIGIAGPAHHDELVLDAAMVLLSGGRAGEAASLVPLVASCAPSALRSLVLGLLSLFAGQHREAERLLVDSWETPAPQGCRWPVGALAAAYLAQMLSIQGRAEETLRWGECAFATHGSTAVPTSMSVYVCNLEILGRRDEADAFLARTATDSRDDPREVVADAAAARGLIDLWRGDNHEALRHLQRAADLARPLEATRLGLITVGYLAEANFRAGRWDDATAHAVTAVSVADDGDHRWIAALLNAMCVLPFAGRGMWEPARHHAHLAMSAAAATGDLASVAHARSAVMWLHACRHEPQRVVELAEPLVLAEHRAPLDHPGVHFAWEYLRIDALLDLGHVGDAAEATDDLLDRADGPARALGLLVNARLLAMRKRLDDAEETFEIAQSLLDRHDHPIESALSSLTRGMVLRRAGRRTSAVGHLTSACDQFTRLAARPWLDACHRELDACGARPRSRHDDARWRLTPQEATVARLIGRGATNREVAAELVIGVKTVEYHAANIFRKLGISSRGELRALTADDADPHH